MKNSRVAFTFKNIFIFTDEEGYDRRLQDLMQDCLPNILVELVEQRPPDPIEAMATALYRYRVNFDLI